MGCHHCEPVPVVVTVDLTPVHARFDHLEELLMATATEALEAINTKVDSLKAAVLDAFSDVRALLNQLAQEQQLSDAARALADQVDGTLNSVSDEVHALDAQVGDADGSDTPPAPPAAEPVA